MLEALLYTTIWLSVAAWAATDVLNRVMRRDEAARLVWTAGAVLLAIHIAIAFHTRHAWSHDAAYVTTARQSEALTGVAAGWGLYLNYLLLVVWLADAAWWWLRPSAYVRRNRTVEAAVFSFFLFMMVNGAIVFAVTPMRWFGVVCVAAVLAARAFGNSRALAASRN
ncbi:MAG: hypothetical protein M3Q55_18015 [Acidobacteriota bacterium]|nr:hypothetical protein [Acidobacteriota bacterium]